MKNIPINANSSSLNLSVIFFLFASIWLLLPEIILWRQSELANQQITLNILKEWGFIVFTSLMLYVLHKNLLKKIDRTAFEKLELEKRWHHAMDIAGEAIWDWKLDSANHTYLGKWQQLIGVASDELSGKSGWLDYVHPDDIDQLKTEIDEHLQGKTQYFQNVHRVFTQNGECKWLLAKGLATEKNESGAPVRFTGVVSDITSQKEREHENQIAAIAFESNEAKMIADANKKIIRVNQSFTEITGYTQNEVIGRDPSILKSGRQSTLFYEQMWQSLYTQGYWQGEIWNRRKNGQIYPEWLRVNVVRNQDGQIINYVASFSDITEIKEAQEQIHNLSYFDDITLLPNKTLLKEKLEEVLLSGKERVLGVLFFININDFKSLNNSLGHKAGDLLLVETARRLTNELTHDSILARFGGDIFSIFLPSTTLEHEPVAIKAQEMAFTFVNAIQKPVQLESTTYRPSARIGITLVTNTTSVEELLINSELAMHEAKVTKENPIRFFDQSMQAKLDRRFLVESKLRLAIPDALFLACQLQVDIFGEPVGAELLIRWDDATEGFISPVEFIPIAENTGLIIPIGKWVLESACELIKSWENHEKLNHLTLSVNVSARQFVDDNFIEHLESLITKNEINASKLKLELTESIFVEDYALIINKMHRIKNLGVKLSLDDFGTGFSSLSHLRQLPLDELKIDRSFVKDIETNKDDVAIIKSIIALGEAIDVNIVAEGVENQSQKDLLIKFGCDRFQGYLFHKPEPAEKLIEIFGKQVYSRLNL